MGKLLYSWILNLINKFNIFCEQSRNILSMYKKCSNFNFRILGSEKILIIDKNTTFSSVKNPRTLITIRSLAHNCHNKDSEWSFFPF